LKPSGISSLTDSTASGAGVSAEDSPVIASSTRSSSSARQGMTGVTPSTSSNTSAIHSPSS